ncbi:SDR family oxidoreductase [Paenibacillus spongiae]|uniref:NmrA family NAD(P)-binding protein n=1 Tax=Paenibacillus spongiae TaxID=2909671 RepID=A0ABY5S5N0_9BACL|nr:NmrA family NAD(P)-binding protein [Paenibacillus spongiae]UVI29214.1 NmrA family NAD(P)-binding protein [Paenibacillus spongiae]
MKIGVIGGTGTVGSRLVRELEERNAFVRILARDPEKHQGRYSEAEWFRGDLEAPDSLEGAFDQLDAVFLLTSMAQNETSQGIEAVTAVKKAGVRKIVFLSVPMMEHMLHIPHIKSKIGIEDAIKRSGMAYTILRPNNFFQNDYWFRDAILQNRVYPQPLGPVGLHRVDVGDIAHAAANALLLTGFEGGEYPLNGPEVLTGEAIAETYSRHTGADIRYFGDDLGAWYRQAAMTMPDWLANDYRVMYKSFQQYGCLGTEQDFVRQKELLLREPRSFDAFVAETIAGWKYDK